MVLRNINEGLLDKKRKLHAILVPTQKWLCFWSYMRCVRTTWPDKCCFNLFIASFLSQSWCLWTYFTLQVIAKELVSTKLLHKIRHKNAGKNVCLCIHQQNGLHTEKVVVQDDVFANYQKAVLTEKIDQIWTFSILQVSFAVVLLQKFKFFVVKIECINPGKDLPGFDVTKLYNIESHQNCNRECLSNSLCNSWSYKTSTKECWIKDRHYSQSWSRAKSDHISGPRCGL